MASEMFEQESRPKIAITGATGYIGERLVETALVQGIEVIALSRRPPADSRVSWFRFDLAAPVMETWPKGVAAVIHLAAQTGASTLLAEEEVYAAECLIEAARNCGARCVFVSSQTARPDAPTPYGRTKAAIEDRVIASGGIVVRPGQVYGGPPRGLFGTMLHTAKQLPMLPRFLPAPLVQPIHVDDLAKCLMQVAISADIAPKVYCLGAAEPVSFTRFLDAMVRYRVRQNHIFLPIPQFVVRFLARALGASASKRFGLEQLLSLFDLPLMETGKDMQLLGLEPRSLEDGMAKSGRGLRRRQTLEARTLLWYVLRQRPAASLIRRYVRMLESMNKVTSLLLPGWMNRFPGSLAIADEPGFRRSKQGAEFDWRLDAATLIAEASPQSVVRFMGSSQGVGFPLALLLLALALSSEIASRLVGLVWKFARFRPLVEEGR